MPRTALTIGNFDGVHAGHGALVGRAREAVGPDGRVVVLCFDPHPASVLSPGSEPARLTLLERRAELLMGLGADEVERLEPTPDLLATSPDDFVAGLVERYAPEIVVEGPDFHFGKGRAGTPDVLRAIGARLGFEVEIVPPVQVGLRDQSVVTASSSLARWLLSNGRVRDAALVLGRPHELDGVVVAGDRRGRTIGFPTANLDSETMLPGPGVYGAIATTEHGRAYAAAVNVGMRPTFDGDSLRAEAHLTDASDTPERSSLPGLPEYGWRLRLELIAWIRDEVAFGGAGALSDQLGRDIERVSQLIGPVGPGRHDHLQTARA